MSHVFMGDFPQGFTFAQYASWKNEVVGRRTRRPRPPPRETIPRSWSGIFCRMSFDQCSDAFVGKKKEKDEKKVKRAPLCILYEDGSHGSHGPGEKGRNFSEEAPLGGYYSPGVLEVVSSSSILPSFSVCFSLACISQCVCVCACIWVAFPSPYLSPAVLFCSTHFFGVPSR